uniref:ABC transporter ATP-binding protein n=2 Tax=Congzhengia minquanensis TaxID=2763657 RepID=A0A926DKE1_9FIRM|nr:ABC transporter ATP-binding protein [Congzhengia minquanensis]MBC8540548.1 ABC transporter ATP-binding protein [Congzhengia minquanensis]
MVFDLFCALFTTFCELILPLIARFITDNATNDIAALTTRAILSVGAIYLVLRIIDTAANYYMASVGHVMGAKMETDMRRDMFAHLQNLSSSFYDNTKVGQIMSRITNDLFDVTEFAHHCPEELFISTIKIVVSFIILGSFNIWLTLIIFSIIPLIIISTRYFNVKMRTQFKRQRTQIGELNAQVEDALLGIRVVHSFANEECEKEKFEGGNSKLLDIKKVSYKYMAGFQSSTRLFDGLMYIVIVVAGAFFIKYGKITAGDFTAYLLYASTLLSSIRRIVDFMEQFQRGMTGIERFFEIMDSPVEITDAPNAVDLNDVSGDIQFDNVTFSYSSENENVLNNLSLHVKPGDTVALVGPSGGGKTTLCSLIPRFYDVTDGTISIDGKDIKSLKLKSLRSNIGVVQQDIYLFSGTVYENIEYGRPGATKAEIMEAAKLAGAHDFIMDLEDGYDTYVGERGVKLSGGQKQRVGIARVFLKNPPILILDEATSALDNESERIVQESLERLAKGRTTFVIAHRLTTIKNASTILVLTENGIEEKGNHKELLEAGGLYSHMYSMYRS